VFNRHYDRICFCKDAKKETRAKSQETRVKKVRKRKSQDQIFSTDENLGSWLLFLVSIP